MQSFEEDEYGHNEDTFNFGENFSHESFHDTFASDIYSLSKPDHNINLDEEPHHTPLVEDDDYDEEQNQGHLDDEQETNKQFQPQKVLQQDGTTVVVGTGEGNSGGEVGAGKGNRLLEIAKEFLPFGLVSFGGPQVHIALLHERFVMQKQWLDESMFSELLGIGQGVPGPTSTQMVIATGTIRAGGFLGGLLAFACFCAPGFSVMFLAALLSDIIKDYLLNPPWWLAGIQNGFACASVALISMAVYRLGSKVVITTFHKVLMIGVAAITIGVLDWWIFPTLIITSGLLSFLEYRIEQYRAKKNQTNSTQRLQDDPSPTKTQNSDANSTSTIPLEDINVSISPRTGFYLLITFFLILGILVLLKHILPDNPKNPTPLRYLGLLESFYRFGSLIIGGGQVLIPMILNELVTEEEWITETEFYNGFAIVSMLPGPMFNLSVYLGYLRLGVPGALLAWLALFGPGIILIFAILPFWKKFRSIFWVKAIMSGVNAAAIGLIMSAVYLLWNRVVKSATQAVLIILIFGAQWIFSLQAPFAVLLSGFLGFLAGALVPENVSEESFRYFVF